MNVESYIDCCKKFAKDTQGWARLDDYNYYTTQNDSDWAETCDNAHGGIDVSWAFHKSSVAIKKRAPKMFCAKISNEISTLVDNGVDYDTFRNRICELMDLH